MFRTIRQTAIALGVFLVVTVAGPTSRRALAQEGLAPDDAGLPGSAGGSDDAGAAGGSPAAPSGSVSVGMTNRGRILNSVELVDAPTHAVKRGSEDARWGTAELVAMVVDAAEAVAAAHPGSRLNVGDLSRQGGGRTRPHRSHRAGRDVDLGFYLIDTVADEEVQSDRFVNIAGSGRGRNRGHSYRFDVARNWTLMRSILENGAVAVQYVLINPSLRRLLLRHAEAIDADPDLIRRFSDISARRSGSASHRSHFHVRIYCSTGDRPRCVDAPPFHRWVFTTDAQVEKAMRDFREYRPPRRARTPRRGRMRRRSRMRRSRSMMSSSMGRGSRSRRTMAGGAAGSAAMAP